MRVGAVLLRNRPRQPQRESIPFKEMLPLSLKDSVSNKSIKTSNVACIEEMAIMFACLKANEFNQDKCPKEITGFQKCYTDYTAAEVLKDERERKGVVTPGEKKMSFKQINRYLARFPQPRPAVSNK